MKDKPDTPMILKAWSLKVPEIDDLVVSYDFACTRAESAEARAAQLEAERDELREKFISAVKANDDLIRENTELREKLEQAQRDITEYRAVITRIDTPKYLDEALNKGDGVYRP